MRRIKILSFIPLFLLLNRHAVASSVIYAQDNLPNHNAFVSSSTGVAGTQLNWQLFKPTVETAVGAGYGGIIDFEDPGSLTGGTYIQSVFNSGQSSFQITSPPASLQRRSNDSLADIGRLPSEQYAIASAEFYFDQLVIFGQQSLISEIGFTLVGDEFNNMSSGKITAVFSGGGTLTLDSNLPSYRTTNATNEFVFYGFAAPPGQSIASLSSSFGGTRIVVMDDLGFVTTSVPEPKSSVLVVLFAALFFKFSGRFGFRTRAGYSK